MTVARRGRASDLVTPRRVPTLPVEVDWSHPLANGLIACYVPGGSRGAVDLAGIGPLLTPVSSAATIRPTSYGPGLVSTANSASLGTTAVPAAWKLTTAGTIFAAVELVGTPVASTTLFGLAYNNTGASPFNDYIMSFGTGTKLAFSYNHAGTSTAVQSTTVMPLGRHTAAATFTMANAAPVTIYQDGVGIFTGAWNGSPPSYTGGGYLQINGDISVPTRILNGGTVIALIYNRVLSASEVALLDADPFCMLRPMRRPVFRNTPILALTSRGIAQGKGRSVLSLSQPLTSRGAAFSRGRSTLSLSQPLTARGAAFSRGKGALTLAQALASVGSARAHGQGSLSLSQALVSRGAAFSQGRGVLLLSAALVSRGAAFSRGRGALSLFAPFVLSSVGSARSSGRSGGLTLSLALASRGAAFSRGMGVLTVAGAPLALVSRGSAFAYGRSVLTFPVPLHLLARGQAFSHGGFAPGAAQGTGVLRLTPFIPPQNVINIGFPQRGYPMVDPKTGLINETWYRFMQAVWLRGGGNIGN